MSFLVALMFASAAAADPQAVIAPQVATPVPAPAKAKEKKICKADEADPGSHMTRRVCKTAEEWNQKPSLGTGRSGFSISGDKYGNH